MENKAENLQFTTDTGRTSIKTVSSERLMKTYTVVETELIGFSSWSKISNVAQTVGYGSLSFAAGLILQAVFTNDVGSTAKAILAVGIPFSVIFGVVGLYLGHFLSKKASNIEDIIRDETEHDNKKR